MDITDCSIRYNSLDISRIVAVRYSVARKNFWRAQTTLNYSDYIHSVLRFINLSVLPSANF